MNCVKHIIGSLALLVFLSICMGSCSSGKDEPYIFDGDLSLLLRVSVLNSGNRPVASRAVDYYFEQPELDTEKLKTLRVIIVNEKENKISHNYFLTLNSPSNKVSDFYKFKVDFSTNYNIYLIGNEAGLSESVQDILKSLEEKMAYPENELENIVISADNVAEPVIDNSKSENPLFIPMSEKFKITTISRPESAPQTSSYTMEKDLFLTRALTKFTFNFYKSENYQGTNQVEIKSVKLSGLGKKEYLIPNNTEYDPAKDEISNNKYGGREITDFKVPDDNTVGEYIFELPEYVKLFPQPNTFETNSYSPQLYFTESLGLSGDDKFQCSISYDGVNYLEPVTLPNLPSLPRNTHVIVNITVGNNNAILLLTVQVLPWEPEYNVFDFTHNVAMAEDGALTFTEGSYASLDKSTGRLVLNDYPQAAAGTFGFSEPEGAQWYAYLITKSGELNAIQFQITDEGGELTTTGYISGTIDSKRKVNFKVVATQSAGSQARTAILQVIVVTDDGLSIPVNILKSTDYGEGIENITFVQNPQN